MQSPNSESDNADWGHTAECAACERWPLRHVSNDVDWHDVEFTAAIAGDTPGDHVPAETPAECKACWIRVSNGRDDRVGRWWIRESSHRRLVEADGWYMLAVYAEFDGIVRMVRLPVEQMNERLDGRWTNCGSSHPADRSAQLPWAPVFDLNAVNSTHSP